MIADHMRRNLALCLLLCGSILSAATLFAGPARQVADEVWVVPLAGAVSPANADLIVRAIDDAGVAGAEALIIQMDTPGGLDKSMRDIIKAILGADLPVVTFVAPSGARAASAGTYIAFASHFAAMAPATNIGSSTPVNIGAPSGSPTGSPPASPAPSPATSPSPGQDEKPATPDNAQAMSNKVINDAVAYLQSLAELRGRNVEWAEQTVREGANLRASEALAQNVIDAVATDLDELLSLLDGQTVSVEGQPYTLSTTNVHIVTVETDWRHELLSVITAPSVAYGLLIIGIYALMLEFYNPGMMFPAMVGIICLLLGAYGLQMLPINFAGIALLILGIVLMAVELITPTVGVLGVGGLVAFVIGSVLLIDSDQPGYRIPWLVIGSFAAMAGALTFFVLGAALKARRSPLVSGSQTMIDEQATVIEDFEREGFVRLHGEIWRARSTHPLRAGTTVVVRGIDGLELEVIEADGEHT